MTTLKPFVVRRDGTLEDRTSGTVIGRVWMAGGWMSENQSHRFGPMGSKSWAAREAWSDWRAVRAGHASFYGSPGRHEGTREDCRVCPPTSVIPSEAGQS